MSTQQLKKLDRIPQRSKCLMFGYIRRIQSLFPQNVSYFNIPTSIINICILYFYLFDTWDIQHKSAGIIVENKIIKHLKGGWDTIFLRNIVNTDKHHWKFKIIKHSGNCLMIGIWNNKYQIKSDYEYIGEKANISYVFDAYFARLNKHEKYNHWRRDNSYGRRIKPNDVVEMVLDFNNLSLSYSINDVSYGKAHDIKKGEYRAAVSIYAKSCIELLSYE